jgi:tetratricopeptide (TPR) repeat protein
MPRFGLPGTRGADGVTLREGIDGFYAGLFQEQLGNEPRAIAAWNEAAKKIDRVLKDAPSQTMALQYRNALQDAQRALETRRLERARYAKELSLFQEGFRAFQLGEFRQAVDRFDQVLRVQPNHALAARHIAEARRLLGSEGTRRRIRQKEADLAERESGILVRANALEADGKLRPALALAEDLLFVNQFNTEARALRTRVRIAIQQDDFLVEEFQALHLGESRRDLLLPLGDRKFLAARHFIRFNDDWYLSHARLLTLDPAGRLAGLIRAPYGKWIGGRLILRELEEWTKDGRWLKREIDRISLPLSPRVLWAIDGFLGRGLPIETPLVTELMPVFESLSIPLARPRLSLVATLALPVSMICLALLVAGGGLRHPETQSNMPAPLRWACILCFPIAATFLLTIPRNLLPALSLLGDASPFLGWFLPAAGTLLLIAAALFYFSRSRPPYRKA